MNRYLLTAVLLFAAPAAAQPSLEDAAAAIDGREIKASGTIGRFGSRPAVFMTNGHHYAVTYAVDRATLALLDECDFATDGCAADVSAEIDVEGDNIRLIVYEVRLTEQRPE